MALGGGRGGGPEGGNQERFVGIVAWHGDLDLLLCLSQALSLGMDHSLL